VFSPWSFSPSFSLSLPSVLCGLRCGPERAQGEGLSRTLYLFAVPGRLLHSWTFYGSVGGGKLGLEFLTIYLGPTIMAALWWLVLRKIILISKENRITTISDFIATRTESRSPFPPSSRSSRSSHNTLPRPPLKAIMTTFSSSRAGTRGATLRLVHLVILGRVRRHFRRPRLDASERHGGLCLPCPSESAFKLVAFCSSAFSYPTASSTASAFMTKMKLARTPGS